jgi:hypothetical protein
VSPSLQYTCRYWAHHLSESGSECSEVLNAVSTFFSEHLLQWLEVLSLLEYLREARACLALAQKWSMASLNKFITADTSTDMDSVIRESPIAPKTFQTCFTMLNALFSHSLSRSVPLTPKYMYMRYHSRHARPLCTNSTLPRRARQSPSSEALMTTGAHAYVC